MTFANFPRNTLHHLLALARAVLRCPADTQLLRWPAAATAVHVETFSCAGTPTDAHSVNAAGESGKETPAHCRSFVSLGPCPRPCAAAPATLRHPAAW